MQDINELKATVEKAKNDTVSRQHYHPSRNGYVLHMCICHCVLEVDAASGLSASEVVHTVAACE